MTSEGSAYARFRRAIERSNLVEAEASARELRHLSLENALSLVILYARNEDPKFEAAAVRWLARLALEGRNLGLSELQLAAAALPCLRGHRADRAAEILGRFL